MFRPNTKRGAPGRMTPVCASANVLPIVGCPAIGISIVGVKMRMRMSVSGRSAGRMNVLSEKFISRAMRCICCRVDAARIGEHGELIAEQRVAGEDVVVKIGARHRPRIRWPERWVVSRTTSRTG